MVAALSLPSLLNRLPDRLVMLTGAGVMAAPLAAAAFALAGLPASAAWPAILVLWVALGVCYGDADHAHGPGSAKILQRGRPPDLICRAVCPEAMPAGFSLIPSLAGSARAAGLPVVLLVHALLDACERGACGSPLAGARS